MSATKTLTASLDLQTTVTNAALAAIKAGLGKDEVATILTSLAEMLNNSDD